MTGQEKYKKLFQRTVDWAMKNQEKNGAWDTFSVVKIKEPFSAMAQGEGASLLVRAYKEIRDDKYLIAAKKAVDFMCSPIADGGCTQYGNGKIWFKEYVDKPVVLNGWIYSIWGLYDYSKASKDDNYKQILADAIKTLAEDLELFDYRYWSKYDMGDKLTSPFYHRLHIAQLKVMHKLFGCDAFKEYAEKWERYQHNKIYSSLAFIVKVYQKLSEKKTAEVVIVG